MIWNAIITSKPFIFLLSFIYAIRIVGLYSLIDMCSILKKKKDHITHV